MDQLLTPSRRKRLLNEILHLQADYYYPLNERNGSVALNYAPKNRYTTNGTVSGATPGQPGKVGPGYSFNGTNNYVQTGLWSAATTSITMGAIFKSDDYTQSNQCIMTNGIGTATTGRGYALFLSGNNATDGSVFILDHFFAWRDTNYNLQDNNKHMIVLVLDASGFPTVYLDGVSIFTSGGFTFHTPVTNSFIGSADTNLYPFKGMMQHGFFIPKILNAGQVKSLARTAGFI
jgi:hypothetical protein